MIKSFQERANTLVQEANTAKNQGRIHDAIRAYREAIELVPAYASLNLVIGDMLFESGDYAGAAEAFQAVVAFDPEHDQAWASLGQCRLLRDDFEGAAEAFAAAQQANPDNVEANYYGAILDAHRGETRRAADKLYQALRLRPSWTDQAQTEALLAPLFESSRKLAVLGREKKWWEIWK